MQGIGGRRHVGVGSLYVPDPAQNGFVERSSLLCFKTPKDRSHCLYGTQLGELWSVVTVGDCTQALSRAYYGDLSGCTNIARAEHFAFSSLKNYMYYAVGGTVYRVDLSEKPLTATTQFTLVGETVTCLKFNIYRQSANLTRTYDLVVGSVKDDTGTLRIYEGFNSDGNFRGVAPEVHTGLGRIVDVAYREMLK